MSDLAALPRTFTTGEAIAAADHLPPVEVFHFDAATFDLGLGDVEAAPGERIPAYTAARTVVDLMRFCRRIGELVALGALRRYLASSEARPGQILELARSGDVLGPVRAAVDTLQASEPADPRRSIRPRLPGSAESRAPRRPVQQELLTICASRRCSSWLARLWPAGLLLARDALSDCP